MILKEALANFYIQNNLEPEGGVNDNWFHLHFKLFSIKIPNSEFRKKVIHIHDIQHILYNCDTTWKGEAFVAGWEIATGLWKQLPIGFMSLWAMGFSLLNHPSEVMKGYKEGLKVNGIINLSIPKEKLLNLSVLQLKQIIKKEKPAPYNKLIFTIYCSISLIIVCLPIILLLFLWAMYIV